MTAKAVQGDAAELVLDTSSIDVHGVSLQSSGSDTLALKYTLAPRHKARLRT